jgi:hypothetical protein
MRVADINANPSLLPLSDGEEDRHIRERFERLKTMTREELMKEIEADYAILTEC